MHIDKPLYGITHDSETGDAIISLPRILKVSIGVPKGPDKHVWIDRAGKWQVEIGTRNGNKREKKRHPFETMEEARAFYDRTEAGERPYPISLQYFTFTKSGHSGAQTPDWEAINKHGPLPTSIDIVFIEEGPLDREFQYWNSAELICHGDGKDAERLVSFGPGLQNQYAKIAKQAGEEGKRRFQVKGGCAMGDCPYYQNNNLRTGRKPLDVATCKSHGELRFQLLDNPMLGGTAYFVTTGKKSIRNLFNSFKSFYAYTPSIAGIPMQLVVGPYKTKTPDKKTVTKYAVHLQFRADSAPALIRKMIAAATEFRRAGVTEGLQALPVGTTPPALAGPKRPEPTPAEEQVEARRFTEEFIAGAPDPDDETPEEEETFEAHAEATPEEEPEDGGGADDEDPVRPLDTIVDPTLAGQMYGKAKTLYKWGRRKVDEEFHDFLVTEGGDIAKTTVVFMRHLEMVVTGSATQEPAAQQHGGLPKDAEYER